LILSHGSDCLIKGSLSRLALLKELSSNCWVNAGQVAKELLRNWIVLEEVKAHALAALNGQALDIIEDQAGKVSIGSREFSRTFFCLQLQLVHSVLKYLNGPIDVILEHERGR